MRQNGRQYNGSARPYPRMDTSSTCYKTQAAILNIYRKRKKRVGYFTARFLYKVRRLPVQSCMQHDGRVLAQVFLFYSR